MGGVGVRVVKGGYIPFNHIRQAIDIDLLIPSCVEVLELLFFLFLLIQAWL